MFLYTNDFCINSFGKFPLGNLTVYIIKKMGEILMDRIAAGNGPKALFRMIFIFFFILNIIDNIDCRRNQAKRCPPQRTFLNKAISVKF